MRNPTLTLLLLGLLFGCSQSAIPPAARISGTYSLAVVKDLLFVTSAERSELRVLDLRANPREFVRAPNPLQPLSIPVLDHPASLARDVDYKEGAEVVGQYVYAQGAASNQISIVGADRATQLFELLPVDPTTNTLQRWSAPGLVSAIAARAPASPGAASTLYVATAEEQRGRLWQIEVSAPDPTTGRISMGALKQLLPDPADPAKASLDPVSALLVLPAQTIAVATRSPGKPLGRTFLFNTENKQLDALNFPHPVRMLATHPAVLDPVTGQVILAAGSRVFGVLDEDACAGDPDCPGILAVDALPSSPGFGKRSLDHSGSPMVTLRQSSFAIITGLTIAPSAPLAVTDGGPGGPTMPVTYPLLGFVSTSNGRLFFFDAMALTLLNTWDSPPQVSTRYYAPDNPVGVSSDAPSYVPGPLPPDGGDGGIPAALGAALNEAVNVTYQGTIPGFRDLPYTGGPLLAAGAPTSRLISGDGGDLIQLDGGNCVSEVGLAAVDADAGLLFTNQGFTCPGGGTFSVRAGGNLPYVVEGGASGYMGRTANNKSFAFPDPPPLRYSRFYYHPSGFDGGMPPPQIEFQMGPGDPNPKRNAYYLLSINPKYDPEYISVSVNLSIDLRFPGALVFVGTPTQGADALNRLFVTYPPANAILEFETGAISPNTDNLRFSAYR